MARSFTSTDVLNTGSVSMANLPKGVAFWGRQDSAVNNARWIDVTGASQFQLYHGTVNNRFTFTHFTDATAGLWYVNGADHGLTLSDWFAFAIWWDGVIANLPRAFVAVEGVDEFTEVTVTQQTAPTGTPRTDSSVNIWIGNNSGGTAPCNGAMEHVTFINTTITGADDLNGLLRQSTDGVPSVTATWRGDMRSAGATETDDSGNGHDATYTGTSLVAGPTLFDDLSADDGFTAEDEDLLEVNATVRASAAFTVLEYEDLEVGTESTLDTSLLAQLQASDDACEDLVAWAVANLAAATTRDGINLARSELGYARQAKRETARALELYEIL